MLKDFFNITINCKEALTENAIEQLTKTLNVFINYANDLTYPHEITVTGNVEIPVERPEQSNEEMKTNILDKFNYGTIKPTK